MTDTAAQQPNQTPASAQPATSTTVAAPAPQAASAAQTQPGAVVAAKQIGKYRVEVINDKCIGAASCVALAPKVFQLNEQNIAEVISQDGDTDDDKLLAAQSCPTSAIIVTDTETNQQVWPRM